MIRVLALLLVVGVWGVAAPAQTVEAPPVDEADAVPGFAAYRARLLEAVVARDIDAILSMAGADIHLSFGGESGRAALRAFLEVPPEDFAPENRHEAPALRERNWADLETVLRMGGRFDEAGRFIAPYPFTFDLPEGMDPFEALFVTGTGVALRARPIRYGKVLGRLDHEVVRHRDWVSGTRYVGVARGDGTEGYVHEDYIRAYLDYRAIFEEVDGDWRMTTFIAGD